MQKSKAKQSKKFYEVTINPTFGLLIVAAIGIIASLLIVMKVSSTFDGLEGLTPDQIADTLNYQQMQQMKKK